MRFLSSQDFQQFSVSANVFLRIFPVNQQTWQWPPKVFRGSKVFNIQNRGCYFDLRWKPVSRWDIILNVLFSIQVKLGWRIDLTKLESWDRCLSHQMCLWPGAGFPLPLLPGYLHDGVIDIRVLLCFIHISIPLGCWWIRGALPVISFAGFKSLDLQRGNRPVCHCDCPKNELGLPMPMR